MFAWSTPQFARALPATPINSPTASTRVSTFRISSPFPVTTPNSSCLLIQECYCPVKRILSSRLFDGGRRVWGWHGGTRGTILSSSLQCVPHVGSGRPTRIRATTAPRNGACAKHTWPDALAGAQNPQRDCYRTHGPWWFASEKPFLGFCPGPRLRLIWKSPLLCRRLVERSLRRIVRARRLSYSAARSSRPSQVRLFSCADRARPPAASFDLTATEPFVSVPLSEESAARTGAPQRGRRAPFR